MRLCTHLRARLWDRAHFRARLRSYRACIWALPRCHALTEACMPYLHHAMRSRRLACPTSITPCAHAGLHALPPSRHALMTSLRLACFTSISVRCMSGLLQRTCMGLTHTAAGMRGTALWSMAMTHSMVPYYHSRGSVLRATHLLHTVVLCFAHHPCLCGCPLRAMPTIPTGRCDGAAAARPSVVSHACCCMLRYGCLLWATSMVLIGRCNMVPTVCTTLMVPSGE